MTIWEVNILFLIFYIMLIDKTIIAANMFAAESNIRPNLAGVYITPEKEFVATNSFIACIFKQDIKETHNEYPDIWIKDFELEKAILIPRDIIKKMKFWKSFTPILEKKVLWNYNGNTIELGETNLNTELKTKTKLNEIAKMPDPTIWGPKDEEINVEVWVSIEYLETTLKALKLISKKNMVPQVRIKIKATEHLSNWHMTTIDPIIFELEFQNEKWKAIIMPIKLN